MSELFVTNYESPLGNIEIVSNKSSIISCNFGKKNQQSKEIPSILDNALKQLDEYFQGKRQSFDLELSFTGTIFQNKVWKELTKIPYGKTETYSKIAEKVGDKKAVRAVGNANGKNPISIIVPCHRVIGSDGKLVGYGGGIDKKKWLLDFEKA